MSTGKRLSEEVLFCVLEAALEAEAASVALVTSKEGLTSLLLLERRPPLLPNAEVLGPTPS